jgi:hypothetical protein
MDIRFKISFSFVSLLRDVSSVNGASVHVMGGIAQAFPPFPIHENIFYPQPEVVPQCAGYRLKNRSSNTNRGQFVRVVKEYDSN